MNASEPEIGVAAKATRRRFKVEYKRTILREADAGRTPGAVGALLRREGLYSSHLTTWRGARRGGGGRGGGGGGGGGEKAGARPGGPPSPAKSESGNGRGRPPGG